MDMKVMMFNKVSFPSWNEGGKEILEFSEVGVMEKLERQGRNFYWGNTNFLGQAGGNS